MNEPKVNPCAVSCTVRTPDAPPTLAAGIREWVEGCPFYAGGEQFPYWANCQVTLHVTTGGGDSFSLEAADGVRFAARSRLFSDAGLDELDAAGPLPLGPQALAGR